MTKGWRFEPTRHAMSAHGVETSTHDNVFSEVPDWHQNQVCSILSLNTSDEFDIELTGIEEFEYGKSTTIEAPVFDIKGDYRHFIEAITELLEDEGISSEGIYFKFNHRGNEVGIGFIENWNVGCIPKEVRWNAEECRFIDEREEELESMMKKEVPTEWEEIRNVKIPKDWEIISKHKNRGGQLGQYFFFAYKHPEGVIE